MHVLNQKGKVIELDTGFRFSETFFSLLEFVKQPKDESQRNSCEFQCELFYRDVMIYAFVDSHNQHLADQRLDLAAKNLNAIHDISIDRLTGLKRKEYVQRKLLSLKDSVLHGELADFSLIMCDLDYFKAINDDYGHSVGDQVLALFGHLLLTALRPSDFAYRYGGEEFLIVLPETNLQEAILVAKRLRLIIDDRLQVGHYGQQPVSVFDLTQSDIATTQKTLDNAFNVDRSVTCSFGVASYVDNEQCTDKLFLRADKNLYTAKKKGRNQVAI